MDFLVFFLLFVLFIAFVTVSARQASNERADAVGKQMRLTQEIEVLKTRLADAERELSGCVEDPRLDIARKDLLDAAEVVRLVGDRCRAEGERFSVTARYWVLADRLRDAAEDPLSESEPVAAQGMTDDDAGD